MTKLKLTTVGTSVGVVVPKAMLARMNVDKGDSLYAIETADGYVLTPYDPAIEEQLNQGEALLNTYRDTFRALADK